MAREQTNEAQGSSAVRTKTSDGPVPSAADDGAKTAVEEARKGEQGAPRPGDRPTVSDYEIANYYFDLACDRLELADEVRAVMRSPYREISVQIPVRMTDGTMQVFTGYRVQHNVARGPYKGGVRYHPKVDLGEVRALAMLDDLEVARSSSSPSAGPRAASSVDPHG